MSVGLWLLALVVAVIGALILDDAREREEDRALAVPERGDRFEIAGQAVVVVLGRRRWDGAEEVLCELQWLDGRLSHRSVPVEDWSWHAAGWLPLSADPELLLPPPREYGPRSRGGAR